jgi:hypothetical protein
MRIHCCKGDPRPQQLSYLAAFISAVNLFPAAALTTSLHPPCPHVRACGQAGGACGEYARPGVKEALLATILRCTGI